jgi:hypothetical protein
VSCLDQTSRYTMGAPPFRAVGLQGRPPLGERYWEEAVVIRDKPCASQAMLRTASGISAFLSMPSS